MSRTSSEALANLHSRHLGVVPPATTDEGLDVSRPSGAQTPVIFCCAWADEAAIKRIFDELASRGADPRTLVGIDHEPYRLVDVLALETTPSVFIICISDDLSQAMARQLVELFTHHRASHHRLLVLELERGRAESMVDAVQRTLRSLRRQHDAANDAPSGTAWRATNDDSLIQSAALLVPDDWSEDGSEAAIASRSQRRRPHLVVIRGHGGGSEFIDGDAANSASASYRPSVAMLSEAMDPSESHAHLPEIDMQRWRTGLAAVAVLWASAMMSGIVADPSPTSETAATTAAAVAGTEEGSQRLDEPASGYREGGKHIHEPAGGYFDGGRRIDEPASDYREGGKQIHEPASGYFEGGRRIDEPFCTAARGSEDQFRLRQAIAAAEVSVVDGLGVMFPSVVELDWNEAVRTCHEQRPAGASGFVLPTNEQAQELARAGYLEGDVYWTSSTNFDSAPPASWVVDADGPKLLARMRIDKARVVCVRELP